MKPLETSQCYISLEELLDDDDRDDLHFDIVNEFNRALNTRDRTLDQAADEADDQRGAESSRSRPGTVPDQSTEGQQLDAEAQKLADKLDELW
ncbi:hypothetical protein FAGAP_9804 [Fusarium agapanthi]|uniref:Uncharacterized protein n=1 Tax=Fusarium agapanthi TaxID=1803897 RepID=A0A9P5B2A6_9HYPO|nr:hypothetical protein FAGAP_9804 [Fusarium agapanthi]